MTLREMVNEIGIKEEPLQCAFVIASLLRSTLQREISTFEGEYSSVLMASEVYGNQNTPEGVREWLRCLGKVPDIDVPNKVWAAIAYADKDEIEEGEALE